MTEPDVVDPDAPIVDPHHHLWDGRAGHHGGSGVYLLDELLADLYSGHRVESTVYVECGSFYDRSRPEAEQPAGEVEFANGVAALCRSGEYGPARVAASIVAHADLLRGPEVDRALEEVVAAGNGRVVGIRHVTANDPAAKQLAPPGALVDPRFRDGYAQLAAHGLTFDAWLYHPQLDELHALAAGRPDVPVAINHAGGLLGAGPYASRREAAFADWRRALGRLAALPQVHVKLGGFFMPAFGFGFEDRAFDETDLAAAARPIVETCLELFGPDRCMFESNFPMTRYFVGYRQLWNSYKLCVADLTAAERAAVLHDTAQRFYAIPSPVGAADGIQPEAALVSSEKRE